jgi:Holliday junction resolvasome RuvABC ATP-dependent DNA helicase subunit
MEEHFNIHGANDQPEIEHEYENALRPLTFQSFSGQSAVVQKLLTCNEASMKERSGLHSPVPSGTL